MKYPTISAAFASMALTCASGFGAQPGPATLPSDPGVMFMADGDKALAMKDFSKALTTYEEAEALSPENPAVELRIAIVAERLKNRAAGLKAINNYMRLDSSKATEDRVLALRKAIESLPSKALSEDELISLRSAELIVEEMNAALHAGKEDAAKQLATDANKAISPLLCELDVRDRRICLAFGKIALVTGDKADLKLSYGLCHEYMATTQDNDVLILLAQLQRHLEPEDIRVALQDRADVLRNYEESGHGVPHSMYLLGNDFGQGLGVIQDYQQAMRWYQKAADAGDAAAMFKLGTLYGFGEEGITQDYQQAMQWYVKAADAGNAVAMFNIGTFYDLGQGVTQDYQQAMQWYRKAADAGDIDAMLNIGVHYYDGHGVDQDYQQAMQWYSKAADGGSAAALFNIGGLYKDGFGVDKDISEAMQYYVKAVQKGIGEANTAVTQLGTTLHGDGGRVVDWGDGVYRLQVEKADGGFEYLELLSNEVRQPSPGDFAMSVSATQRLRRLWPNVNFDGVSH